MNDLRTAAQAVLDDFQFMKNAIDEKLWKSIEALRQALASEPSVDALIGEIDGLDGVSAPFATESDGLWIDADELKVILDKYRGVK